MKKIFMIFLTLLYAFSIASCSSDNGSAEEETSVEENEEMVEESVEVKPYFEENGFTDSSLFSNIPLNWATKFSNSDFTEVYDHVDGLTLDNGQLYVTITNVTKEPSLNEGHDNIVINYNLSAEINFTQDNSLYSEDFYFLANFPGAMLFDYDTGEVLNNGSSLKVGSDNSTISFTFTKNDSDITINTTSERENNSYWSDWVTENYVVYNATYYYDRDYVLTVEVPSNYDGLVLSFVHENMEELESTMLNKEDDPNKYVLDDGYSADDHTCMVLKGYID